MYGYSSSRICVFEYSPLMTQVFNGITQMCRGHDLLAASVYTVYKTTYRVSVHRGSN